MILDTWPIAIWSQKEPYEKRLSGVVDVEVGMTIATTIRWIDRRNVCDIHSQALIQEQPEFFRVPAWRHTRAVI